jgi:CRP/FNR family transcriptional regulator, cyclic AMP receptor protein
MALNDVYGRLKQLLESLAQTPDGNGRRVLQERLTHQEIANRLGCSREMVSRLVKDLQRGGFVEALGAGGLAIARSLPAKW